MKKTTIFGTFLSLVLVSAAAAAAPAVSGLRCEHRTDPLGIDAPKPRLSWAIQSAERGERQTAYELLVASSAENLAKDRGDLWQTGKVVSDQCVAVRYTGATLASETRYWWKARAWCAKALAEPRTKGGAEGNKDGQPSAWSQPATFLTGKLSPQDWRGKWIGPDLAPRIGLAEGSTKPKPAHQHGAIYLRKEFDLAKPVVRAVLSFSGLGFSEVAIDGWKVGDYVIGPGFTDYDHRVPYLTFDVSARFSATGRKRLDVALADGWYALKRDPWCHKLEQKPYVDLPKLRLDLRLVHADGSETLIVSDESWQWSTGEITRSWIAEEDVDLRKAGEASRQWQPVAPVAAPRGQLLHQKEPFNRIVEEFRPASMRFDAKTGTATYEIGREVNGHVRFLARGPAGTALRITTIPSDPTYPRTSAFVLAGTGGKETYEPRFFHAGMRRVTVSGLVEEPAQDDLIVCCISSMRTPAGAFRCSDEFINWLEQAVRRTMVNYTTFLPNDPVREWKAWAQDIQNMFGSAFYFFAESQAMYERWQYDLLDSQRPDGNMANVAPGPVFDAYNSPWWGGCGVWLPWEWRLAYGDDSLLRESYAAMKRYVDFLNGEATKVFFYDSAKYKANGLQKWGLGDWLAVEETPVAMINTPAHFYYARIVSQTAEILGQPNDSQKYAGMAGRVRDTFNQVFLDSATGIYGENGWKVQQGNGGVPGGLVPLHEIWWNGTRPCTQAGQVLPLALGLVPEASRPAVEAALLREIAAHRGRLSTGFVSTPYLLDVLTDLDPEACWRLATTREFPSWYSMTRGSGNDLLKETWAGGQALMPSLGGSIARWCYRGLGGIRPDPDGPGFRKIIIRPAVVGGLEWVECHHDSPCGRIVSNWKRERETVTMEITIPANTTATVYVPAKDAAGVTESGKPTGKVDGVKFLQMEDNRAVYAVGSGTFRFQSKLPEAAP
ncbi:MAG: alpha-L-rhamnosidase N-terminal domain-containing protein [Planctomycetota bacterium]|nr:alpha-L-rhamnosidase N-terminal domain-containing protein [Planctomycetota bacterium]